MDQVSHLARTVDPRYPTNLAILIISGLAFVGGIGVGLISGQALVPAFLLGLHLSAGAFFAWVIGREIDPDHNLTAMLAAVFAMGLTFWLGWAHILTPLLIVMVLRVVNRIIGLPPLPGDVVAVTGIAFMVAALGGWPLAALAAGAFIIDGQLDKSLSRISLISALMVLIAGVVGGSLHTNFVSDFLAQYAAWLLLPSFENDVPIFPGALFAVLAGLGFVGRLALLRRPLTTRCDVTNELVVPQRVLAAQMLALVIGLIAIGAYLGGGVAAFGPLWAALAAGAIGWVVRW